MKRFVVAGLDRADQLLDAVLYRPAIVELTAWLPRWWLCDLSKLSMRLDDRWSTGYWDGESWVPVAACEACARRAAIVEVGGWADDGMDAAEDDFMAKRKVLLCGWCELADWPIHSEGELVAALADAKRRSISWRWGAPASKTS